MITMIIEEVYIPTALYPLGRQRIPIDISGTKLRLHLRPLIPNENPLQLVIESFQ